MAVPPQTSQGWWRFIALVAGTGTVVAVGLFLLVMGWLIVDAVTARQGPGEIPKVVGVVVLMPVAAVGAALVGGVVGAAVAPFRLERDDAVRRPAFAISATIVVAAAGTVAWIVKELWLSGATG